MVNLTAGGGLGVFDAGVVAGVGLPTTVTNPGSGDPGQVDGAIAVDPTSSSDDPEKFSMGVKLPTVPARLVKRILAGEFVEIGELSQEALRAEFKRSGESEESKSSKAKFRPVADKDAWVAGFVQYAGVWCRLVMSCPDQSTAGWWRSYDLTLRHGYSSAKEADFCLNQCLYTQAMVESSAALQKSVPAVQLPPAQPRAKRRKVQACFAWNDSRACAVLPCRYAHCCSRCGDWHTRRICGLGGDMITSDAARPGVDPRSSLQARERAAY